MSKAISKGIREYYKELDELAESATLFKDTEGDTDHRFGNLLNGIGKDYNYFVRFKPTHTTESNTKIEFDTGVYTGVGIVFGVHEAKRPGTDLEKAIEEKRRNHYPFKNIIFENSQEAILYQDGERYNGAIDIKEKKAFNDVLERFFSYASPEIQEYNQSQKAFFEQIPDIIKTIRDQFELSRKNPDYIENIASFENLLKGTINPNISRFETREIIIQHLLTIDIFSSVFSEIDFKDYNPIAKELDTITHKVFRPLLRKHFLSRIDAYLKKVKKTAVNIEDFGIKKQFLINFYEQFYKAYNPKGADRLGMVYTPEPVVQFMIRGTDHLLGKHFGTGLAERNVNIVDPATGTGTFIYYLLEYLFEQKAGKAHRNQIRHKYKEEIFCNEVSILPYYIASLCIEKVYHQYTGEYELFEGIVYQDTLENVFYKGHTHTDVQASDALFKSISQENIERQKRQNEKKMTVIIGNPPYNANQQNENENNKNREYPIIDKKVKETYIKESSAQSNNKLRDPYIRFLRWASDRIQDHGIVAFITNNSFIDSKTYDGFRKIVEREFDFIYVINFRGDARTSGELRRKEAGNIFENKIREGVAISFYIKLGKKIKTNILYHDIGDYLTYQAKQEQILKWKSLENINFEKIKPNKQGYWLNTEESDFEDHIPTISKDKKEKTIFEVSSLGVNTNRDLWVFDLEKPLLENKVQYFIREYNGLVEKYKGDEKAFQNINIKWASSLKDYFKRKIKISKFKKENLIQVVYRPFSIKFHYFDKIIIHRRFQLPKLFGPNMDQENVCICFSGISSSIPFQVLPSKAVISLDFLEKTNAFPLYRYEKNQRQDNITDWALGQFQEYYSDPSISKSDIFHYIYAVLNNPSYVKKYKIQLARDYPRIPFYASFKNLAGLGKELLELHIHFEKAEPYADIKIVENKEQKKRGLSPILKVNKEDKTLIHLDNITSIQNVPEKAYQYKLGLRSPIEWVLDQHKLIRATAAQKANYGVIFEKFNTPENELRRYQEISKSYLLEIIPRLVTLSLRTLEVREEIEGAG